MNVRRHATHNNEGNKSQENGARCSMLNVHTLHLPLQLPCLSSIEQLVQLSTEDKCRQQTSFAAR